MRVAIIGTPRSGNAWLRSTLATALEIQPFAEHNWTSYPDPLPEHCMIGIHWYREPNFQSYLDRNGFQTIILARHPLDVMLSVLSFSRREPAIARWLGGNAAIPAGMYGADPADPIFLDWATGFGAENLLSISYQWWQDPDTIKVRYEDLIASPDAVFGRLIERLGATSDRLSQSLVENDFAKFKALPNRHGWQGVPGLYRTLFTAESVERIYRRHRQMFDGMEYAVGANADVSTETIREAWARLS